MGVTYIVMYVTYVCDLDDKISRRGVKVQGEIADKTCDRTTTGLMFYYGIACTNPI